MCGKTTIGCTGVVAACSGAGRLRMSAPLRDGRRFWTRLASLGMMTVDAAHAIAQCGAGVKRATITLNEAWLPTRHVCEAAQLLS